MRARLRLAVAAAAAVVTAAAPAVAFADTAPGGHIVQIKQSGATLNVVFAANGLPDGVAVDPGSVTLTVNGNNIPATAKPLTADSAVSRAAMLVIDTSGSMKGAGITGAKTAAERFLASVPADVKVGLVAVSGRPSLLAAPTTDRKAVKSAIARLTAHGETALYDGVGLALRAVGKNGPRNLVVLSDGADTTSHLSLGAVRRRLKASGVTLEAVGFRTGGGQTSILSRLASSTGGRVVRSGQAGGLASAFAQAARDIAGQVLVTAKLPATTAPGSATIAVQAQAGTTALTDSAFASLSPVASTAPALGNGPRPVPVRTDAFRAHLILYAGIGALFLGAAVLFAFAFAAIGNAGSESQFRRRLSIYTLTGKAAKRKQATALGDSGVARGAVEFAGRVVARRGFEEVLGRKLEAAGVPLKPSEWLLVHVGIVVVVPPLLLIVTGGNLLFGLIGAALAAALPWLYLSFKESRRNAAFLAILPDTLQLIAGGLQAGFSLPQALDAVVREGNQPIASEFNRALVEARLGVPLEDALEGIATRTRSTDFAWVVMAIKIQREVGGNLAEVLENVATTLRERERLRRQVRVLSAEGRLSAWILGCLPVLFGAYLVLVRRDYVKVLVTDKLGIAMLVVLVVTMTTGILWLRKVVKVEV